MENPTAQPSLPDLEIFTLIGVLPETYSGVIQATISRASQFADISGRPMTILTKSQSVDPVARQDALHATGALSRLVRVRNIWHDITTRPDGELSLWARPASDATHTVAGPSPTPRFDGTHDVRTTHSSGELQQVTRFRDDGTVAFTDRFFPAEEGGGRRITAYLRDGTALGEWSSAGSLYFAWFDWLTAERPSVIINESSEFGATFSRYRRPHVLTVQRIHSNYLARLTSPSISAGRYQTMTKLDWFDLVAVLTTQHAKRLVDDDMVQRSRVRAVPNAVSTTPIGSFARRDPLRGVVLARHAPEKRLDHVLRATQRTHGRGVPVVVDAFGAGPLSAELQQLSRDLDVSHSVHFHGHVPNAKEHFRSASFSVLSSSSEGQGLVVLESMMAGCIPISYDLPFGPAEMIEDGVNGFLVENGDVHALADRIAHVAMLPESELISLRQAAVMAAERFDAGRVVRQWGTVLRGAWAEKQANLGAGPTATRAELSDLTINDAAAHLRIRLEGSSDHEGAKALISWISRDHRAFLRFPIDLAPSTAETGISMATGVIPLDEIRDSAMTVGDVHVDLLTDRGASRIRVRVDSLHPAATAHGVRFYRTVHGNLSLAHDQPTG